MNSCCSKASSLASALHRCKSLAECCASSFNFYSFYPSIAAVSTHFDKYRASALGVVAAGSGIGTQPMITCMMSLSLSRWSHLSYRASPALLADWLYMGGQRIDVTFCGMLSCVNFYCKE
jgi:hypothetical protein